MTDPDFDRRLAAWLAGRAQPRAPHGLAADIVERTARSRPRPAWRIPERWFSMPTSIRLALVPRSLVLTLLLLGLLLSLTAASLAIAGGTRVASVLMLPAPPTGPAANGLIAFERDADIFVVAPGGTDERPLIVAPGIQTAPSWSRDGTRIAYWSAPSQDGPWDVMIAAADGTDAITVATGLTAPYLFDGPDWSPDGSTLIVSARTVPVGTAPCTYTATLGEFCSSRIFAAATDGSTGAVAIGDPDLDARAPVWSPDGSTIAFGGGDARTPSIRLYLMAADGSDVRSVSTASGNGWSFIRQSWSPDGRQIVAQVGRRYWDIVLVAADGSGDTMLTRTPGDENLPSFAADGSIAWSGDGTDGRDPCCLVVLDTDGVQTSVSGSWPVWSPDGTLVVTTPFEQIESGDQTTLIVIDRAGATVATIPGTGVPSWQRLAP